jgi:hypothetical protein
VRFLRILGFAGAVLLAIVGWLGGALPHADLASTPLTIARGPHGPFILVGWLVGTVLLAYAWWASRNRIHDGRGALGTAALWAAPFLVVPPMGSRDVYSYACQGYLYLNGVSPYENGVGALPCPWLDAVSPIWRDTTTPYGPLFVLMSAAGVRIGGTSLVVIVLIFRLLALLGLVAVAAGLPVLARRCGIPVERAWWVALAGPLVGAHMIAGAHNDALMMGLVVAGLALATSAAPHISDALASGAPHAVRVSLPPSAVLTPGAQPARETPITPSAPLSVEAPLGARNGSGLVEGSRLRAWAFPVLGGVLLGLAVAIKVSAIVVVPFAILLVVARPYRWRQAITAGGLLAAGAVGTMVAMTAASGLGYGWVGAMVNTKDLVQFTSPPTAIGMTATYIGKLVDSDFDGVPAVRALALLLFAAIVAWLWLRNAFGRPVDHVKSVLRGAALAMAAMVALSPYFHPWYAYWALALLAATTLRTDLIMAAATAGPLLVLADGSGLARFVKFPGAPLMTVVLVVLAIRYRPQLVPPKPREADVMSGG